MKIHGVTLTDFRGISHKSITFQDQGITIISGPNQSGKSSVIEAIGLVLTEQATSKKQKIRRVLKRDADRPAIVEIDVTIGGERLQLRKKFGVGRASETLLTFPESAKQPLNGSTAHNYVQELLNQHEDTALFEALRFLQEEALDSFRLTSNQSALQAALDAAADHQYDDDSDLLSAVEDKFAEYFTPKGRENKSFTSQRAAVTKLAKTVQDIEAQVSRVQEESRAVEELSSATAQVRESYQQALAELNALRATLDKQEALAAEIKEVSQEAETIGKQLTVVSQLVSSDSEKRQRIQQLRARSEQLHQQLSELPEDDVDDVAAQKKELAAAEQQFSADSQRAAVANLIAQHDDLDARRKKLSDYHKKLQDLQNRQAQSSHDESVYTEAQRLVDRIAQLEAASALSATSAHIQALSTPVLVGGETVTQETTLQITEDLAIEVPEVVRITLTPGREAAQLHHEQIEMGERLLQKLEQLGVSDWDAAVAQRDKWLEQQQQLDQLEIELRAYAEQGDLAAVTAELTQCAEKLYEFDSALQDEVRRDEIAILSSEQLQAAQTQLERRKQELLDREHAISAAAQQRDTTSVVLKDITQELGSIQIDEELAAQHREEETKLSERSSTLAKSLNLLKENYVGSEEIHKKIEHAETVTTRLKDQLEESEKHLIHAQAQLEVRLSEGYVGKLQEAEAEYDVAKSQLSTVERQAAAVSLLRTTLEEARSESTQRYQQPYLHILHQLGHQVWGSSFQVTVGEDLQIATAITKKDSHPINYEDLSAGTKEQLAVLSRLACFQLVDRGAVPVMLDDVLGYSDPQRLDSMVNVLSVVAKTVTSDPSEELTNLGQIFIFTCTPERFADIPAHRECM